MQKDVIYIDVEDDITAIIGKVKASKQKIVALVPPKRIGVLQSAVNLRLLERASGQAGKKLVLISNNPSLLALAAGAKIPVAKNLQSKPELGEIAALDIDDGEDIIDGSELPIGDHVKTAEAPESAVPASAAAAAASVLNDSPVPNTDELPKATPPAKGEAPAKARVKKGTKIPDFNKFRKRIMIGVLALALLIPFLIWAIVFAPRATILISAKTTEHSLKNEVALSTTASTAAEKATMRASEQQVQKPATLSFAATGSKDVGTKAKGTARFSTQDIDNLGMTIPAGTTLTANGGSTYTTDAAVTFTLQNYRGTNVGITASANGEKFNGATGSLAGAPAGVRVSVADATSGGTDKVIKVVTADDIAKAKDQLITQNNEAVRQQLAAQFDKNTIALKETLASNADGLNSSPGQDQESSNGQATLSGTLTYTMLGVARSEIKSYLESGFDKVAKEQKDQRVYDAGSSKAVLADAKKTDTGYTVALSATGKIGPQINDAEIKAAAAGKRYGDVQSSLTSIQGVRDVDVKFSPFWVSKVPDDPKRITIQFRLDESK